MIIMGVDPGYAITGFGIIEQLGNRFRVLEYGVVSTPAGMSFPERLLAIDARMTELLEKWNPEIMAVEELFFNTNVTTAIKVGHARGIVLLGAARRAIPVYEYTPMQVKMAVVGYGKAKKEQVQMMVKVLLGMEQIPKPDDAADALAVAICQANLGTLHGRAVK